MCVAEAAVITALTHTSPHYTNKQTKHSLAGGAFYAAPCGDSPYEAAFREARAAGILTVAAAGNDGRAGGLPAPACAPSAVAVGAVYDSDIGRASWGGAAGCVDAATAADRVAWCVRGHAAGCRKGRIVGCLR